MKFEEVLPLLKEGKKIRIKYWYKDIYIFINSNGKFENQNGYHFGINLGSIRDLEADQWEIVKETKKVKLRDICGVQFEEWKKKNCTKLAEDYCHNCPFQKVKCCNDNKVNDAWYLNKDLYSDKFLDQEIEVEE